MKFNSLTNNIITDDMNAAVEFYRDRLGFQLIDSVPEAMPYVWCMMTRDDVSVMFQSRESLTEELPEMADHALGQGMTWFLQVTGLDELYADLKDKVDVLKAPYETFYGMKEFYFKDFQGQLICFAERIAS